MRSQLWPKKLIFINKSSIFHLECTLEKSDGVWLSWSVYYFIEYTRH